MPQRIIYKNTDGGVSVIIPADGAILTLDQRAATLGMTKREYLDQCYAEGMTSQQVVDSLYMTVDEIAAKDVPSGTPYEIIDAADQPDRTFRAAWRLHGKKVREDLTAAVEIAHEKRRIARSQEFAPLDMEATIPSKAAKAEEKRQAVRDKYERLQSDIDTVTDVDVLRDVVKGLES